MIQILDRWTAAVLYASEKAADQREAVVEAARSRAYLSGANLSRANLSGADLSGANLSGANLSGANLSRANLPDGMAILQVLGSMHAIVALSTPEGVELRISCHHHSLAWWQEHYQATGRANDYSAAQIQEYAAHIAYAAHWAASIPREKVD